jgi:hypothetical protein
VSVNNGASCAAKGSTGCGNAICNASQTCLVLNGAAICAQK